MIISLTVTSSFVFSLTASSQLSGIAADGDEGYGGKSIAAEDVLITLTTPGGTPSAIDLVFIQFLSDCFKGRDDDTFPGSSSRATLCKKDKKEQY